jgi:integrase
VPARRKDARVLKRWIAERGKWRVITVLADGGRHSTEFGAEAEADKLVAQLEAKLARAHETTVERAIAQYQPRLLKKGNQPGSVEDTIGRLRDFFGRVLKVRVAGLTESRSKELYAGKWDGERLLEHGLVTRPTYKKRDAEGRPIGPPLAVDSQRNILMEAKTFARWWVDQSWVAKSPLEKVKGEGERNHGGMGRTKLVRKQQKAFFRKAVELAGGADEVVSERATAVLTQLLFATRSTDVVKRRVMHIDTEDWEFEVKDGKTPASDRTFELPKFMRPFYQRRMKGKRDEQYVFGAGDKPHDRDWVRDSVHMVCRAAGLPPATAHSLKGMHAELARDLGVTPALIAQALAHTDYKVTTRKSYQKRGTDERATQRQVLRVLEGGLARKKRGESA